MKLVIVESPTKARTISRFLGKGFKVESSYGHVRDLPKSKLGVEVDKNFEPQYVIPTKSRKQVNVLKKEAEKAESVILATDEDREGEAIAWHLNEALGLGNSESKNSKAKRIVFHEITKKAIEEALSNPRGIDMKMVDAQQARRVLDRLVGYSLSPFLWKKILRGLSAGRVQSVAVRLIAEREEEINKFKPEEYWSVEAELHSHSRQEEKFPASLVKINNETLEKFAIPNEKKAKEIEKDLNGAKWSVAGVEKKASSKNPLPPFTTSTLQQTAFRRLGFSAKQTMMLAQQLYEGVELPEGQAGLISYMRTDSFHLSEESLTRARETIKKEFGEKYSLPSPRRFKTKTKSAQEAHEAIRPTDPARTPESIKKYLERRQFRLYELIWRRFTATQMPEALFDSTSVETKAEAESGHKYVFRSSGHIMKFDGFLKVWPIKTEDINLPELKKDEKLELEKLSSIQHFTQPPPRYTEASLIKTLEQYGIGRPSTYAPTLATIQDRRYVEKDESKRLKPTEVGIKVNELLVEHFPEIVDVKFTAEMEANLDEIAEGKKKWAPIIKEFYEPFSKHLAEKYETVEKQDMTEKTDEVCEKCGKPMVIKHGRFGRFLACSGFPECKNAKPLPPVSLHIKCPKCHEGEVVERTTRRRRIFYGCSRYPKCDFASWQKPNGEACPKCSSHLVYVKDGLKCSSKSCDYLAKELKTAENK